MHINLRVYTMVLLFGSSYNVTQVFHILYLVVYVLYSIGLKSPTIIDRLSTSSSGVGFCCLYLLCVFGAML